MRVSSVVARAAVVACGGAGIPDRQMFRLALGLASPELADQFDTCASTGAVGRLAQTLAAYELRARTRATPFGVFAGVGTVTLDEAGGAVRLPGEPVAYLRPNSRWLDGLIRHLETDPGVLSSLTLALRYPFSVHGDRVFRPAPTSVEEGFARSVLYTDTLRRVIVSLRGAPCRVDVLLDRLRLPERPDVAAFHSYLAQLITGGFLLTSLRPASSSTAPLADMAAALRDTHTGIAAALTALHAMMGLVEMGELAERVEQIRAQSENLGMPTPSGPSVVQVDTAYRRAGTVPVSLCGQAVRYAQMLDRIALRPGMPAPLGAWHRALVERFGIGRPVPILLATDPVSGVGLPRWAAHHAANSGRADNGPAAAGPAQTRLWEALLHRARDVEVASARDTAVCAVGGRRGVVIEDDDLPPRDGALAHPARDLCVDVYSDGRGRWVIAPAVVGGASAGAFSGRLRAVVDAVTGGAATADLRAVVSPWSYVLDFRTADPRAGNVNRPTDLTAAALAIDHVPTRPADLSLDEVTVTATLTGVTVGDDGGAAIELSYTALFARDRMPGLVRLLVEITQSQHPRWMPWTWGSFAALPFTPRVSHDGVIVCRAQWATPHELRTAAAIPGPTGAERFTEEVARWRAAGAVPRIVQVSDGTDQVLPLDLADTVHLAILRRMLRTGPVIIREDLLSAFEQAWGRVEHMEVVLTLTSDTRGQEQR